MLIAFAIILMMFVMLHMFNISWEFSLCQIKNLISSCLLFWSTVGGRYTRHLFDATHPFAMYLCFLCWLRDLSLSCFKT